MPNTAADSYLHVIAALIRHPADADKVLISRRPKGKHLEDLWEFPGGKMERGESRFQALQREIHEELGIHVITAQPFQSVFHRYQDKNIHLDVWELVKYHGQPEGREGQEIQWVSLNDLSSFEFPDADKPILSAMGLPSELLITPDVSEEHEDAFIDQFDNLMNKHPYPLVQFRAHHLDNERYAAIAARMSKACEENGAQLIISRPKLKQLQDKQFKRYQWRHLNSAILQSITENPFASDVMLTASCHDRAELNMAERIGCRFALLSTVRETGSHPGRKAKGWYQLRQLISGANIPVYALGGVRRRDFCVARFQGAVGVAGITDFWVV